MSFSGLTARMAWRYLRAPKSYSAVSAISIVSVTGVAVATAAIICVLSVFNGFRNLLNERLDSLAPDIIVTPLEGKTFADGDSVASLVKGIDGVSLALPTVSDNALLIAQSREMPIKLKGVDFDLYRQLTSIDSLVFDGHPTEELAATEAVVSVGVAQRLGIYTSGADMFVFAPKREGRINTANPLSSFLTDSLRVGGIFQAFQSEYDENTVICDIEVARNLFQYDTEASAVELKILPGRDAAKITAQVKDILGPSVEVKDRVMQQEMNFRMVSIEKWVTFLLLVFILVIASFNIITTMCMLVLEKEPSLSILSALGMKRARIGMTFWWESIYVSLGGGVIGVALGIILCILQQCFGFIKLSGDPGALTIRAYPVLVEPMDILWSLIPVVVIGLVTASIASAFARSRIVKRFGMT